MEKTTSSTANTVGKAGEHLVCSDILMHNIPCFIVEGKSHYDLIADINGRLLKIQVKSTASFKDCPQMENSTPVYMFNARKYGKGGRCSYQKGDADIIAYVALDKKIIAYMNADKIVQSATFRLREFEKQYYCKTGMFMDNYPFKKVLETLPF